MRSTHLFDFQPKILLVNKQINKEARGFLYRDNLFVLIRYPYVIEPEFWTDLDLTLDLTQVAAGANAVSKFRSALLISLQVDFRVPADDIFHDESQFVIAGSELPVFCRILKQLDNVINDERESIPGFRLVLRMFPSYRLGADAFVNTRSSKRLSKRPHSLPHQRALLEPFVALHGITKIEIADGDGKGQYIDAQLMADIKERASQPPDSMKVILNESDKIKVKGNEAFRASDFSLAYSLYSLALQNLNSGRRYLNTDTREGVPSDMPEETYYRAHLLLAMRIRSNSVAALLHLQQWVTAHERATEIIEKIRFAKGEISINPDEVVKIHHRRALASKGMGKIPHAVEEIREALSLDPRNTRMKAELKEWLYAMNQKEVQAAMKALSM